MSDPSETVGSPAAAALPARLAERALAGLRAASTQHAALLEDGALCARVGQVAVASDFEKPPASRRKSSKSLMLWIESSADFTLDKSTRAASSAGYVTTETSDSSEMFLITRMRSPSSPLM